MNFYSPKTQWLWLVVTFPLLVVLFVLKSILHPRFCIALMIAGCCQAAVLKSPRAASADIPGTKAMAIPQPPQFIIHWDNTPGVGMLIESKVDLTDESWQMRAWCGLGVTNVSFPRTNNAEFFRTCAIQTDN